MKYQFSTECTWLYLFLRTVRRAKILYPRTKHDIDLRQAPKSLIVSARWPRPLSVGQSTATSSAGSAFLPFGIAT
jgi:hypothetical protein